MSGRVTPPPMPKPVLDYLAGFVTAYVYGPKPTPVEKRKGYRTAGWIGDQLARQRMKDRRLRSKP